MQSSKTAEQVRRGSGEVAGRLSGEDNLAAKLVFVFHCLEDFFFKQVTGRPGQEGGSCVVEEAQTFLGPDPSLSGCARHQLLVPLDPDPPPLFPPPSPDPTGIHSGSKGRRQTETIESARFLLPFFILNPGR